MDRRKPTEIISAEHFEELPIVSDTNDRCWRVLLTNGSQLTVLDRMTGYGDGLRDIETGYRDKTGAFWLASGGFDVREYEDCTYAEVIKILKRRAHIRNYKR